MEFASYRVEIYQVKLSHHKLWLHLPEFRPWVFAFWKKNRLKLWLNRKILLNSSEIWLVKIISHPIHNLSKFRHNSSNFRQISSKFKLNSLKFRLNSSNNMLKLWKLWLKSSKFRLKSSNVDQFCQNFDLSCQNVCLIWQNFDKTHHRYDSICQNNYTQFMKFMNRPVLI